MVSPYDSLPRLVQQALRERGAIPPGTDPCAEVESIATGHSRGRIWRVGARRASGRCETRVGVAAAGDLALRRWDADRMTAARLLELLRFQSDCQACLASYRGTSQTRPIKIPTVVNWPNGSPVLQADDDHWTIETWLDGEPFAPSIFGEDTLESSFGAIAEAVIHLHAVGRERGLRHEPSRSLGYRAAMMQRWVDRTQPATAAVSRRFHEQAAHAPGMPIQYLNALANETAQRLVAMGSCEWLVRMSEQARPQHWTIRDLWSGNLLWQANHIVGIVDFGAAAIEWPGIELVRLAGSLLPPGDPRIDGWLDAYRASLPTGMPLGMTNEDFHRLDACAAWLAIAQWLEWFADGTTQITSTTLQRIEQLSARARRFPPAWCA